MHIKKIKSQHRRDFQAIYECEHCGAQEEDSGYDDAHFHQSVVPNKTCKQCGKTAGPGFRALTTKYHESEIV